jgi:hypothetical protein
VVLVGGWELLQLEEGQQRAEQGSRVLLVCEVQPEQDGGISGQRRWGGGRTLFCSPLVWVGWGGRFRAKITHWI